MAQELQPTVEEVQQLFEAWRSNKKRRDRIPEALWEAAVSLSRQQSAHQISKLLHLNHTEVKYRIAVQKPGDGIQRNQPAFIELDLSAYKAQRDMVLPSAVAEYIIEMEKPGGEKIKISFKGNGTDIVGLSKSFFGAA